MRAVVDTNILVRALLNPDGSVGPVVDLLRDGRYVLLYSKATLGELIDVLGRPRMVRRGELVQPSRTVEVCRDPKDDKFLEIAVAGAADVIVTGDRDLEVLHPFEGIPVVQPSEFLWRLRQAAERSSP